MIRLRYNLAASMFTIALGLSTSALAEEGMWMPSQMEEIAVQMKKAGAQLPPEQLADLSKAPMNAIVSLGGCSASFMSPEGLVVSNHHCVYGSIQYNSKPDRDLLTNGFLAKTKADELPAAPGSRIFVIEDLRNVTADMLKGLRPNMTGRTRFDVLDVNRKRLIADCEKLANRRCDVRAYFNGERYFLQQQLEIKDVRLAYAPAGGIGNFGGETDNWQWPRHTGDFGFYRAYVAPDGSSAPYAKENVPYKPKSWLKLAKDSLKEGDFVMLAGFPGNTDRWRTVAETKTTFNQAYPLTQKMLSDYSDLVNRLTAGDQSTQIKYANSVKGADNTKKNLLGKMAGADAISLIQKKEADDAAFRTWVNGEAKRVKQYGPALATLDALIAEAGKREVADIKTGQMGRVQMLSAASTLYRWAKERAKPDVQREAGFQDRDRLPVTERMKQIERRFDAGVDRRIMEWALEHYRGVASADRNEALLAKIDAIGLDRLYAETKLGDTAMRIAWMDKSAAEFEASNDPFIQLAVAAFPYSQKRLDEAKEMSGKLNAAWRTVMAGQLEFAKVQGKPAYPDANGSLRITYGKVAGRVQDGMAWGAFTTAEGMVAKQRGRGEFNAPAKAVDLVKAKDYGRYVSPELGTLPVNYLTTVDITGGNSGSATLNAKGELVGLAFDGTLDGVISDWRFEPELIRTIHVDHRYMMWIMDKVDGADNLLKEMDLAL
ncbi:MAG: S46 family peptidase [Sphingorhabdus sp.]